eukprot:711454-Pyramimonas_sp.AAC.1
MRARGLCLRPPSQQSAPSQKPHHTVSLSGRSTKRKHSSEKKTFRNLQRRARPQAQAAAVYRKPLD